MARALRVEYPGAYYHVMNRGNGREDIFKSDRDRERFLGYLGKAVERFAIVIHTYCLMKNHYHLLVETPEANLSRAIQWVNVSYAAYYNRKRRRSGHLFQGRFKAILIDADEYLKHLSRYIHLNAVRAKIVVRPHDYKWSSYREFIGEIKGDGWLETGWLLSAFGSKKKRAMGSYKEFVEGVDPDRLENPSKELAGGFILGDKYFVEWVKERFLSDRDDEDEIPQLKAFKPKVRLEGLVQEVCREFDCREGRIREKGRKRNKARAIAIYLARDLTGLSCKDLGSYFGSVSGASITMTYNRAAGEIAKNRRLKGRSNKIKNRLFKSKATNN